MIGTLLTWAPGVLIGTYHFHTKYLSWVYRGEAA